jgi:hypothetical protein
MRTVILAVIVTAGLSVPFSFMAGTLVFGNRIKAIEAAEKSVQARPLPKVAHFKHLTADCIQLVDDKGRSRIELFFSGSPDNPGLAAVNFVDYVKYDGKDSFMNKMTLYSYGNGKLAGFQIDSPPDKSLYDFELTSDGGGPRLEMHHNEGMFNTYLTPQTFEMNI